MSAVFLKLLNMSITAGWLVIAVIVLRLCLKRAPKAIHCALWALVAIRLLCPFSLKSNFSLIPEEVANGNAVSEWTDAYIGDIDIHHPSSVYYDAAIGAGREPISDGEGGYYVVTKHDQLGEPDTIENTVVPVLSWVWLVGVAALLLYAAISYLRIRTRVKVSLNWKDNIWRSEQVDSPFILGMFRPKIYIPFGMDEAQMYHVVAHEQAHLSRRDHWWKPLGFILLAVYWFNPLMWVAYILLCRDIELACDEKVIRDMGAQDKKAYSEALLAYSVPRRMIAACPLAFGEVGVKKRIASVLHYKKPAFWILIIALIASVAVAVCFLTNPAEDDAQGRMEDGYYLLIGADGVQEIQISLSDSSGGVVNADGSFFKRGEEVYLAQLQNVTDLRGVEITALGKNGEILYALSIPEGASDAEIVNIVGGDGWLLAPTGFMESSSTLENAQMETVTWTYSPMMSATWHGAFHFYFDFGYSHVEASCDNGMLWNLCAGGQPMEKSLRFEAGEPVCWNPGIDGGSLTDTTEETEINFTVYDGGKIIYTGTLDIIRTGTENGQSFYEARLVGTDLLALRQENGNMGASVITAEAYQEMVSPATVIYEDADLDHDGRTDRIHVREVHPGQLYELSVSRRDGTLLWSTQAAYAHTGWNTILLCREGGKDYLVQYNPTMFQGVGSYGWTKFSLEGGHPAEVNSMYVDFELPLQIDDSLQTFSEQTDRLLEDCTVLLSTEQFTPVIGPCEAMELPQIYPVRFDPDDIQIEMDANSAISALTERLMEAGIICEGMTGYAGEPIEWAKEVIDKPDGSYVHGQNPHVEVWQIYDNTCYIATLRYGDFDSVMAGRLYGIFAITHDRNVVYQYDLAEATWSPLENDDSEVEQPDDLTAE